MELELKQPKLNPVMVTVTPVFPDLTIFLPQFEFSRLNFNFSSKI